MLTGEQRARYARSLAILGEDGQQALARGRVLVVGAGGVGCAALLYLAAAGVGTLGVADGDRVELSNLQRQVLYTAADLGRGKAASAARALAALNPDVRVRAIPRFLTAPDLTRLARDFDFVIDGVDGAEAKLMLSDACVAAGVPFCHCGTRALCLQVMTCLPGRTPCLRCAFGRPDPAVPAGTLGPACGAAGSMAAAEAIKFLTGQGVSAAGQLVTLDLATLEYQRVPLARDPDCPACGGRPDS